MGIQVIDTQRNKVRVARVFDNGGKTMDRYTATFELLENNEDDWKEYPGDTDGTLACVHISEDTSPRGVSMWSRCYPDSDFGKEITFKDLPKNVQEQVIAWMVE